MMARSARPQAQQTTEEARTEWHVGLMEMAVETRWKQLLDDDKQGVWQ
jgi:hypothetical protein